MLAASAWKYVSDDNGDIYRIQVNGIDGNTRDIVESSFKDWTQAGEGWSNNGQILFFVKKFDDPQKWDEWIKKFKSFNLKVLDRDGNTKKEIKAELPKLVSVNTGRACSKCKQVGHNAATCRSVYRKQATQQVIVPTVAIEVEKGHRICSICKQKGHNARTCKNK